jgi:hypothetical protein
VSAAVTELPDAETAAELDEADRAGIGEDGEPVTRSGSRDHDEASVEVGRGVGLRSEDHDSSPNGSAIEG